MFTFEVSAKAIVDDEFGDLVSSRNWYLCNGYVRGYDPADGETEYLHRIVAGAGAGDVVDHINRNSLDNRKENLRIVPRLHNALNAPKQRRGFDVADDYPRSPYKGAHWQPQHQRWTSSFRNKYLGMYDTDIEAAAAYDQAVRASGIPGAFLNFPDGEVKGPALRIQRVTKGHAGSASQFRGVAWNSQQGRWQGSIKRGKLKVHLGFFDDEKTCAGVYDTVVRAIDGPSGKINFPDLRYELDPKLVRRLKQKGIDI